MKKCLNLHLSKLDKNNGENLEVEHNPTYVVEKWCQGHPITNLMKFLDYNDEIMQEYMQEWPTNSKINYLILIKSFMKSSANVSTMMKMYKYIQKENVRKLTTPNRKEHCI